MSEDFNWKNDPDIVQRNTPAVAIYENQIGQIVIRQERDWDQEDDTVIRIAPENARRVADAILAISADQPQLPPSRPKRREEPLQLPPPNGDAAARDLFVEGVRA